MRRSTCTAGSSRNQPAAAGPYTCSSSQQPSLPYRAASSLRAVSASGSRQLSIRCP